MHYKYESRRAKLIKRLEWHVTVERLKVLSHTNLAIPMVMKLDEEEEEALSAGLQTLPTEVEAQVAPAEVEAQALDEQAPPAEVEAPKADDDFLQLLGRRPFVIF
ncbi:hypothetical protein G5714_004586 [Onychostoma macrolepis]|uniref:Uncharacterized protein n=1 Tax=Onychostoma macrolepis TaxID=369639 RepID=A0A7J6D526_9TELE|nr:hypothetical protein G5714_004586 [Onychostoma macrolepis]